MPGRVRTGAGSQLTCYKCGKPGHFARECDNPDAVDDRDQQRGAERGGYRGRGGFRGRGRGRGRYYSQRSYDDNCYRCGEAGHYARDCENDPNPSPPYRRGRGRMTDHCYRCGESGHMARDCHTDQDICYNCHKPGHVAKDCTEEKECYRCKKIGHSSRECPEESIPRYSNGREKTCYNCGIVGHLQSDCPTTECYRCHREGHVARKCPYEEDDERRFYTREQAGNYTADSEDQEQQDEAD